MEDYICGDSADFAFAGGVAKLRPCSGGVNIELPYKAAFGGGERYHTINLKNHSIDISVTEKFCEQGEQTYCPAPFFFTDSGFGLYADTGAAARFTFGEGIVYCELPKGTKITLFSGTPQTIIAAYMSIFGKPVLPPHWTFLPWISANRWNTPEQAEAQIDMLKKYDFPAGVIVLEAWSDEATFYQWSDKFPNPKAMIDKLHVAGLKVVLWQIPVYKKQGADEVINAQNEIDRDNAIKNRLCVFCKDGEPYTIPDGNWFAGSMIPDFTNPATRRDWFAKRQYLLDMGIDGFKTDGGEFIYRDDLKFYNGENGADMRNRYAQSYISAYTEFLPKDKVLFSRAGYAGQHTTPILWAGDQKSTFAELRAQLKAGLSAAMSGIIFWGFDIGGFAGKMPSANLYLRAAQMACFCPIMQWHSEPDGGQFKEIMATSDLNNERSPWHMAKASGDPLLLEHVRFYHKLRIELLPYIKEQAAQCASQNRPLIYPLAYAFMDDERTHNINDEFMFGNDYLIAPILEEGATARKVYLPSGDWQDYWSKTCYKGNATVSFAHEWHIPVFLRVISAS